MIIGGIQKISLIDYPSRISCVVFTSGCNFSCPYCHNPALVGPVPECIADDAELFSFLKKRKPFLDGVVVSGGEPTLQKDLLDFCARVKQLGYPVKLDTNGSNPHIIEKLIHNDLIDYFAMDIKTDPERYAPVVAQFIDPATIRASIRLILDSGIEHEFRTTCVKSIINKEDIRTIARLIQGSNLFALQKIQFHNIRVLNPEFFQTSDRDFDDQTLEEFQMIASDFVRNTVIR